MGDESKFPYDAMGIVGNPICGDQMKMFIQVKDNKIVDLRWKTYGCASAIASTSALSEIAKGKTLEDALKISAKDIDDYLGNLPKHKFHCSILGHDALKAAIKEYKSKNK
jgi:nitrogen fixation NifU-like protein